MDFFELLLFDNLDRVFVLWEDGLFFVHKIQRFESLVLDDVASRDPSSAGTGRGFRIGSEGMRFSR